MASRTTMIYRKYGPQKSFSEVARCNFHVCRFSTVPFCRYNTDVTSSAVQVQHMLVDTPHTIYTCFISKNIWLELHHTWVHSFFFLGKKKRKEILLQIHFWQSEVHKSWEWNCQLKLNFKVEKEMKAPYSNWHLEAPEHNFWIKCSTNTTNQQTMMKRGRKYGSNHLNNEEWDISHSSKTYNLEHLMRVLK